MIKEIRFSQIMMNPDEMPEMEPHNMIVEGYAAVFNQPTVIYEADGIQYREMIDPNAFAKTNSNDCCLKYNHLDSVPILARTRGGSLELMMDNHGLKFRARLFNTQAARDVYTLIREGALDKCSFAFTVADGGERYDRENRTRIITDIGRLWDCSIVDVPAYDQTSVSARDFFAAQVEMEQAAKKLLEQRKRRLL